MFHRVYRYVKQYSSISEYSGSFGDLGTLLPILVSLSQTNQISLTSSLIFGGAFNIIAGLLFDIPVFEANKICVQPMKSIAGIALLANLSQLEIMAAGLSVAVIVLILTITGLMTRLNDLIPLSIVRGVQLGGGLSLISKGITLINASQRWNFGYWTDNYIIAFLALLFVLFTWRARRSTSALVLLLFGIIASMYKSDWIVVKPGLEFPAPAIPTMLDFYTGFIKAGLGQIPLTLLNSVIAVSKLAEDLYPDRNVASIKRVGLFLGMMNLCSAWFGCIPYCCGSGGLAAQHRFGARRGLSVVFLGVLKLFVGLMFGNSLLVIFKNIPSSIVGVMLVVSGLQLALVTIDYGTFKHISRQQDAYFVMMLTGITILGFANDGIGFIIGVTAAVVFKWIPSQVNEEILEVKHQRPTLVSSI